MDDGPSHNSQTDHCAVNDHTQKQLEIHCFGQMYNPNDPEDQDQGQVEGHFKLTRV